MWRRGRGREGVHLGVGGLAGVVDLALVEVVALASAVDEEGDEADGGEGEGNAETETQTQH